MVAPTASTAVGNHDGNPVNARFDGLQVMRGIAALLVLLLHAKMVRAVPADMPLHSFFQNGAAIGVDLFS